MSSGPIEKLHKLVDAFGMAPGVRHYRMRAAERRFLKYDPDCNLFRGVFETYEEAAASAPSSLPQGYDNDASALMYLDHMYPKDRDYPAMFWLEKSFAEGCRTVVDLGGSIGIKYYAFSEYLSFPHDLRWTVCDVPAVARNGRKIAQDRNVDGQLAFTDQYHDMSGVDVLYASGSVQYLPKPVSAVVGDLAVKPRRVLINTAAIHPTLDFYTLNYIGRAYCPYRVQSVETLKRSMAQLGYIFRASWRHPEKRLDLPFNPGYSLSCYMGFCFDLES